MGLLRAAVAARTCRGRVQRWCSIRVALLAPLAILGRAAAALQVSRCVDQADVREGLGEVPEMTPRGGVVLFREESDVVAKGQQPLENLLGLVVLSLKREDVRQPERAEQKYAFTGRQAVNRRIRHVAPDEASRLELLPDQVDRSDHARIVRFDEPER